MPTDIHGWISLKEQLPPADTDVEWYDAMFHTSNMFAMHNPAMHDPDFSHWRPIRPRPEVFADIQPFQIKPLYFRERNFIKDHKFKWLMAVKNWVAEDGFERGAKAMLRLIEDELKRYLKPNDNE